MENGAPVEREGEGARASSHYVHVYTNLQHYCSVLVSVWRGAKPGHNKPCVLMFVYTLALTGHNQVSRCDLRYMRGGRPTAHHRPGAKAATPLAAEGNPLILPNGKRNM